MMLINPLRETSSLILQFRPLMCHFFLLTNFLSGQIEINQNDNVTINFYNMEAPTGDRHTFTIDDPYSVDLELAPERN
jgi:hypothetical protein